MRGRSQVRDTRQARPRWGRPCGATAPAVRCVHSIPSAAGAVLSVSAPDPPEACTVTWETGAPELTVSCPHGRTWVYEAIPVGDRPLPHLLWELPWMLPPGTEWELDDDLGTWSATVIPVSEEIAGQLFAKHKRRITKSFG